MRSGTFALPDEYMSWMSVANVAELKCSSASKCMSMEHLPMLASASATSKNGTRISAGLPPSLRPSQSRRRQQGPPRPARIASAPMRRSFTGGDRPGSFGLRLRRPLARGLGVPLEGQQLGPEVPFDLALEVRPERLDRAGEQPPELADLADQGRRVGVEELLERLVRGAAPLVQGQETDAAGDLVDFGVRHSRDPTMTS